MVKTYKGTKEDPLKLDLWQKVVKVHWATKGNMSLSVSAGIHQVVSPTLSVTVGGVTLPNVPDPSSKSLGASMHTSDLRQWLQDHGGTSGGGGVSINISVHGTSRAEDPLAGPIDAFWEWFISANNGVSYSYGGNGGLSEGHPVTSPGVALGTNASRTIPWLP